MNNAQLKAWILSVKAEGINISEWVKKSFGPNKKANFVYNFLKKPDAGMRHENVVALQKGLQKLRDNAPFPAPPAAEHALGDSGNKSKRLRRMEVLDEFESWSAKEQQEFLTLALMHQKHDAPEGPDNNETDVFSGQKTPKSNNRR